MKNKKIDWVAVLTRVGMALITGLLIYLLARGR